MGRWQLDKGKVGVEPPNNLDKVEIIIK